MVYAVTSSTGSLSIPFVGYKPHELPFGPGLARALSSDDFVLDPRNGLMRLVLSSRLCSKIRGG